MAQDTWINLTLDTNNTDVTKQRHQSIGGASGAGDLTLSWSSAKLGTNLNNANSAMAELMKNLIARGFK